LLGLDPSTSLRAGSRGVRPHVVVVGADFIGKPRANTKSPEVVLSSFVSASSSR